MTAEESIVAAKDALGIGLPDDYKIQPTKHADELAGKAPALAAILRRSELAVLAEQYEKKDAQAFGNQKVFKDAANNANWCLLLTACFSVLLLVIAPLKAVLGVEGNVALLLLGACGVIAGALGSMWVYKAREGKLLDNWLSARAAAEALRTQYFDAVTGFSSKDTSSAITPLLLQFEYFRRYQLDVQLAFFERRSVDHRHDADRMLKLSSGAVALASISSGLAAVLGGFNSAFVSIAAVGSIATALASFASTKESVNQSRRNAERYANTSDALAMLRTKLDAVRMAAAAGNAEPVRQFVAAAHEQLSAEHRQWLANAQSIQPAIDKLDDALSNLKKDPPDEGLAPGAKTP